MSDQQSWVQDYFGGQEDFYGHAYTAMGTFAKKDTEKEVEGILSMLRPEPGSHVLDWCGGWGRHAVPLAKRGFQVTVLDTTKEYLDRAQTRATEEGVSLNLVHADFRDTPRYIQADYAVNLFTAGLGYFGEKEDLVALRSLRAALKPRARILIDTMSLFWIVKNFKAKERALSSDGAGEFHHERTFDFWNKTMVATNTFVDKRKRTARSRKLQLKIYSPESLARILKEAGFQPNGLFGDLNGSEFTLDSKRLVMVAERA